MFESITWRSKYRMNLEYIEDLINRENINLIDTYLEDSSGAFVNYNKLNIILYDSSKLPTLKERKEVLDRKSVV